MKKNYEPKDTEVDIYSNWEKSGYFNANPDENKQPFCIMIPPPNVTGTLHMGHGFQNTLMDALIRQKRMSGFDVLWQVGVDHAGIATQMVVERQLEAEGTSREQIGRDAFEERVWQWKDKSGNKITQQLRRLGASVDWTREAFTMSDDLSLAVKEVFIKLHEQGLIYRGERLVNWDTVLKTALSDLEVSSEEEDGNLWHIDYRTTDGELLTVATTRPETLLGDTALAVNPQDERYVHLIGKRAILPIVNREIPIIADDYVESEFGTGCVKITPAHDFNDFEIGKRHDLEIINILNLDGSLNENVPEKFQGLSIDAARELTLESLEDLKQLRKTEVYKVQIPRSERSNSILQPLLTKQWFVDVKKLSIEAIRVVEQNETEFIPKNWENTYFNWMNEIQDWCISRQLWWGHRIPAWYDSKGEIYVGKTEEEIREKFDLGDQKLTQEEDVLDTWFSSALWTFSTLGWPKDNNLLHRYHPTSVLVTGFDIIFFWVARMIMMTTHFIGEVPFKKIFIHGLIKDSEGQKMSKSKGNTLDPLDIIDGIDLTSLIAKRTDGLMQPKMKARIEKQTKKEFPDGIKAYGTDALRLTFCSLASGGRDINFDIKRVEGYRNFCNKLWNASRYIQMNIENYGISETESETVVDAWINYKFDQVLKDVNKAFEEYRLDLATKALYEFIWYEFCDWYIEFCKISLTQEHVDRQAIVKSMVTLLEKILRLAHPIMPFVTEEIWGQFKKYHKSESDSLMISPFPVNIAADTTAKSNFQDIEWTKEIITGIRNIRGELLIKPSTSINALVKGEDKTNKKRLEKLNVYISNLCNLSEISWKTDASDDLPSSVFALEDLKVMIPLEGLIDPKEEKLRLDKKLDKLIKEKEMLGAKLSNDNFIKNAPEDLVSSQQERFNVLTKELENLQSQMKEIQKLI
jgi:valyl-tRNA synthetase|tara:strand:- start:102 stop:2855 length:2754 start_codon:yes stop_codon:yes gene_type:complete